MQEARATRSGSKLTNEFYLGKKTRGLQVMCRTVTFTGTLADSILLSIYQTVHIGQ